MMCDYTGEGVVADMCNLSELIVEETEKRVVSEKLIESVNNIIENFGVSLEKACEVMKTTVDEYEMAKSFLGIK